MGSAIIQQPDGKFCMFSSVTDGMEVWDATEDEILGVCIKRGIDSAILHARDAIDRARGDKPQYTHYPSYMEAVLDHNRRYPEDWIEPVTG